MRNLLLKLLSSVLAITLMTNLGYAEGDEYENSQTIQAGSKKLEDEEHLVLKKKRVEEESKENERGKMVSNGMYLTTHPMAAHGIYKTIPFMNRLELTDGSIWQVIYPYDLDTIHHWMYSQDQVIICPGTLFDAGDYLLVSQRTGEVIPVNLVEMEVIIGDPYFRGQRLWIERMDYLYDLICGCYYYEIRLNDGSCWEVDARDHYLCSLMYPGDVVFIGVDERLNAPTYNILVHFNTLEYVHADCVAR